MMRTNLFTEQGLDYDLTCINGEDYDLWSRAIEVTKITNLPEVLALYRYHPGQTIQVDQERTLRFVTRIHEAQLKRLGLQPTPKELETHLSLGASKICPNHQLLEDANSWLHKLSEANRTSGLYAEPEFSRVLQERWIGLCMNDGIGGLQHIIRYLPTAIGNPPRLFEVLLRRLGQIPFIVFKKLQHRRIKKSLEAALVRVVHQVTCATSSERSFFSALACVKGLRITVARVVILEARSATDTMSL